MLQSEAGYINARPHLPDRGKPLATHGRTIHSGHERRISRVRNISASPPTADMTADIDLRCFGPLRSLPPCSTCLLFDHLVGAALLRVSYLKSMIWISLSISTARPGFRLGVRRRPASLAPPRLRDCGHR